MKRTQIVSDPKILGGKPIIEGTRISVELILDRISAGMSEGEILQDYPHLTAEKIQAAVSYARRLVGQKKPVLSSKKRETEAVTLYTHEISR